GFPQTGEQGIVSAAQVQQLVAATPTLQAVAGSNFFAAPWFTLTDPRGFPGLKKEGTVTYTTTAPRFSATATPTASTPVGAAAGSVAVGTVWTLRLTLVTGVNAARTFTDYSYTYTAVANDTLATAAAAIAAKVNADNKFTATVAAGTSQISIVNKADATAAFTAVWESVGTVSGIQNFTEGGPGTSSSAPNLALFALNALT